ncbi:MAG TPA: NAD(P)H-dependent oxidoreductase [Vitreimonas sp.]|nr:NAD(P)H-dependent oxidoreductase [Vitreimonas sp.]
MTTNKKPQIAIIVGSTRPGRNADKVLAWFETIYKNYSGIEFEVLDLQTWDIPLFNEPAFPTEKNYTQEVIQKWSKKIENFDGYIVLLPEYNRGYPAVVKNAFDHLYTEWNNKPIAFVGYGTDGGIRAVEQMRLVAIELQMLPIREQVALPIWEFVATSNHDKYTQKATIMLEQLHFWLKLLKST